MSARVKPRHDVAHERQGPAGPRRSRGRRSGLPKEAPSASHPPGSVRHPARRDLAPPQQGRSRWRRSGLPEEAPSASRPPGSAPRQLAARRRSARRDWGGGPPPSPGEGREGKGREARGKGGRVREGGRGRGNFLHTRRQAHFSRVFPFSSSPPPPQPQRRRRRKRSRRRRKRFKRIAAFCRAGAASDCSSGLTASAKWQDITKGNA